MTHEGSPEKPKSITEQIKQAKWSGFCIAKKESNVAELIDKKNTNVVFLERELPEYNFHNLAQHIYDKGVKGEWWMKRIKEQDVNIHSKDLDGIREKMIEYETSQTEVALNYILRDVESLINMMPKEGQILGISIKVYNYDDKKPWGKRAGNNGFHRDGPINRMLRTYHGNSTEYTSRIRRVIGGGIVSPSPGIVSIHGKRAYHREPRRPGLRLSIMIDFELPPEEGNK